jgi:hypothetical protein
MLIFVFHYHTALLYQQPLVQRNHPLPLVQQQLAAEVCLPLLLEQSQVPRLKC